MDICVYMLIFMNMYERVEFQTCGTMTSGGTESILMAVKTYRESARKRNPGIKPQMYPALAPPTPSPPTMPTTAPTCMFVPCVSRIVPVSAHAAFAKARTRTRTTRRLRDVNFRNPWIF